MKLLLTLILLSVSLNTFAHGEDKPGPNGGYLKMPGGFHTEAVPQKDGSLKVYLLDIEFKNPTVKNSKISATLSNGTPKTLDCTAKRDHFICKTSKAELNKGTLTIVAERNTVKGAEAIYSLPFSLTKTSSEVKEEDHGSHH